jgi:hypothetical protein
MTDQQYEERDSLEAREKQGESLSDEELSRLAAYRIHSDGSGRGGWDDMMNDVDDETAEEIINTWANIVLMIIQRRSA